MAGYGTDEGLETWATDNGYTMPATPTSAVLRQKGSVYVDGLYGGRFPGYPVAGIEQDRLWPRTGAEDIYGNAIGASAIPTRVIEAAYFAAYLEGTTPGILTKTFTPSEQKVLTEVKGIKWTIIGDGKGDNASVMVSTTIEGLLYPLLSTSMLLPAILVV